MPDGRYITLQKQDQYGWKCIGTDVDEFKPLIDKNHSVENPGGKESHISYVSNEDLWKFLGIPEDYEPTPEPVEQTEEGLGTKEITATISDTTQITRAIAEREAGEKLRKIYKNTARYKPRSWPTKLTLFLGRGFMKDHYTRKYMKMK